MPRVPATMMPTIRPLVEEPLGRHRIGAEYPKPLPTPTIEAQRQIQKGEASSSCSTGRTLPTRRSCDERATPATFPVLGSGRR